MFSILFDNGKQESFEHSAEPIARALQYAGRCWMTCAIAGQSSAVDGVRVFCYSDGQLTSQVDVATGVNKI